jgi:uncharacterized membrane protein YfcA
LDAVIVNRLAAAAASTLTLISGFGLGTFLTPVFALFFPIETAIAATAIVHLANNIFKLGLLGKHADWNVVVRFGLPAVLAAFLGAAVLVYVAALPALATYEALGQQRSMTLVKLVIGTLIAGFALLQLSPRVSGLAIPPRYLPWGGALSGFFGGLSGNQGAFRSAFLIKCGLDKTAFIATGVVCAVLVDLVRIGVYGASYFSSRFAVLTQETAGLVAVAALSAFAGAWFGRRMLRKVTLHSVHLVVAVMMFIIGLGLATGFI